jgi:hypothetical protein
VSEEDEQHYVDEHVDELSKERKLFGSNDGQNEFDRKDETKIEREIAFASLRSLICLSAPFLVFYRSKQIRRVERNQTLPSFELFLSLESKNRLLS